MRALDALPRSERETSMGSTQFTVPRNVSAVATCNRLLAALPDKEMNRLYDHLEFVYLESGREVCREDEKSIHVYFPTTAIVAMLHRRADGSALEIGAVGCEGMVGAATFLERGTFGTAVVQFEGGAYRADTAAIEDLCHQGGHLQPLMLRYTWTFLSRVLQSSANDRHWSVEQRLSCWLLERLDRLPTNELKMTQEMIAAMLGVRRESVTEAIGKMRRDGVVRCRRGSITVLDRGELETRSGECYLGKSWTRSMR